MSAARTGLHRHQRAGRARPGSSRRRVAVAALAAAGLSCGTLPVPAAAEVFPADRPRWSRDASEGDNTYRVTRPRQGRAGDPERSAVRVWQELLNEHGLRAQITGVYERDTERAVRAFQARRGLPVTGQIDRATARALLERTIKREAAAVGMSADLLCGHLNAESRLDPAAVGPSGDDLGLGQILIGRWNPGIDVDHVLDEDFAVRYMAQRDRAAYRLFGNWRVAVFDYNYPVGAHEWNHTGRPSSRGKSYSEKVFRGCDGPEFPGDPDPESAAAPVSSRAQVVEEVTSDVGGWLHQLSTSLGEDWDTSGADRDG